MEIYRRWRFSPDLNLRPSDLQFRGVIFTFILVFGINYEIFFAEGFLGLHCEAHISFGLANVSLPNWILQL
ncbi:unnamed protein product [Lathyrus oleraceus]